MPSTWYSTGTLAVTNGSTTVTGAGTQFTLGGQFGDNLIINGLDNEIASINSDTSITLVRAYSGTTASGVTSWAIMPTQSRTKDMNDAVSDLIDSFGPLLGSVEDFNALIDARADDAEAAATAAAASQSDALASKNAAATSATNSANSATTSTTQAGIATTKAGEAATSASNAATSKTGADTARDAAVAAQAAAEAALASTLSAFDSFDDRYLGPKPSAPTVDNDGNALVAGAIYYRTTATQGMYVWTGSAWAAAYVDGALYLPLAGGTLTGALTLSGAPTSGLHAATKTYVDGASTTGNAATATKWATGRTITLTGDATGVSGSFDGSGNLSFATTLANSGATAGTYKSVTVDAKGRVTAGTNPTTLSGYGITDALPLTGGGLTGPLTVSGYSSANTAQDLTISRTSSGTTIQSGPNITLADGTTNNNITIQNTQGALAIWNYNGGSWTERFKLGGAGNLGLGISPSTKVHAHNGTAVDTFLRTSNSAAPDGFDLGVGSDGVGYLYNRNNSNVTIGTNNAAAVVIDTSKNVSVLGTQIGVNSNKIYLQHTGTNGIIRTASGSGSLNLGANGSNHIIIATDGTVGVGLTPTAGTTSKLQTNSDVSIFQGGSQTLHLNSYYDTAWRVKEAGYGSAIRQDSSVGTVSIMTSPASVAAGAASGIRTAMAVDKDANVGTYGTLFTVNNGNLLLQHNGSNAYVRPTNSGAILYLGAVSSNTVAVKTDGVDIAGNLNILNGGDVIIAPATGSGGNAGIYNDAGELNFMSGNAFRGRFAQTGQFLAGTSAAFDATVYASINAYHETGSAIACKVNTNGSTQISFYDSTSSSRIGWVGTSGSATFYSTSSDRRKKTNIQPVGETGHLIDQIEVVSHGWKESDNTVPYGFIAQDLYKIAPHAVIKGDDDPDTITNDWGVDPAKLVPMLVKELQSLRARVAELEGATIH